MSTIKLNTAVRCTNKPLTIEEVAFVQAVDVPAVEVEFDFSAEISIFERT